MKIQGKLIEVSQVEKTKDLKHEFQELVFETVSGQYSETIAVKFWNKEISGLTEKEIGLTVAFDLKTQVNTSNGKRYNNLSGRNCHIVYSHNATVIDEQPITPQTGIPQNDNDDLPY